MKQNAGEPMEVLILEGVREDLQDLSEFFTDVGFVVHSPPPSDPARYFVRTPVDLLVLNLHYENLDPYPIIALARKKKIPTIIVSRSFHQEEARTACRLGAKTVWDLPLDRSRFFTTLREFFPTINQPSKTILIIDDVEETRSIFSNTLRKEKFRTLEASTGEEGLSLTEENDVDLILLDIGLPDICGKDLLHSIRSNPRTASLPVLICTVRGKEETLPPDEHAIQKPVSPKQLVAQVAQFFPQPSEKI
ncbi:MAG: response regulator [Planctomycetota bacterium]|nr:response regulator [Planctomycetota bacterium]